MNFKTVLDFWFGELVDGVPDDMHRKRWFSGGEEVDNLIKRQFTSMLLAGSRGELDPWELTPTGRLAFILVLDQFPRSIFRGTPNAFLYDEKSLSLARDGVEFKHDRELSIVERVFFYMPYQHSEDMSIQLEGIALYRQLVLDAKQSPEGSREKLHEIALQSLEFAERHKNLLERFGRFPHRNKALGRQSTQVEESYLLNGGSRFGQ